MTWLGPMLRLSPVSAVAVLVPAVAHAQADGAVPPISQAEIPDRLRVPEGQPLPFRALAGGTQEHARQRTDGGAAAWTFRRPRAVLLGDQGEPLGIHGRGPFRAGDDGSRVVGSAPLSAPGRDPVHDVPWRLLRATSDRAVYSCHGADDEPGAPGRG